MLKLASPSRTRSAGVAPSGAITFTATPRRPSNETISSTSSRWRNPSAVGPRILQRACSLGIAPHGECPDQLVEGFGRSPVLLFLVRGQFDRHHRYRQSQRPREAAGIVLDKFRGAGGADQQRLGLETLVGLARGVLEQLGGIAAEVARLERRIGDRGSFRLPLYHGEQQVGVGVALRRVQHVMQPVHRGGDSHRPDMGRTFICPERELHGVIPPAACAAPAGGRTVRRGLRPDRSPAPG